MAIKKGDFIEIDYTGRVAEDGMAFDTTIEKVAKDEGIHSEKTTYGLTTIVVGEGHVIQGLDKQLEGVEPGKHTFEIPPEEAFGKKSGSKLNLVPMKVFRQQNIRPMVGLQVNVDDEIGVIRSVSGGRIMVDFNHPLASKNVKYEVDVKRILDDPKEKLEKYFSLMSLPYDDITIDGNTAKVTASMQYPPQLVEQLANNLKRMTGLDDITFEASQNENTGAEGQQGTEAQPQQQSQQQKDSSQEQQHGQKKDDSQSQDTSGK